MATSIASTRKFWSTTAIFTMLWGALVAVMIALPLYLKGHRAAEDMQLIILFCVLGGAIAAFFARIISRWLTVNRSISARFAATFILLSSGTIAITAMIFALHFREYFTQWHAPAFTVTWVFQLVFTCAYSVYLFGATVMHTLAGPMNVIILILCAWIFEPRR